MDEFTPQSVPSMESLEEEALVSKPVSDFVIVPPVLPVEETAVAPQNDANSSGSGEPGGFKNFFNNNKWYIVSLVFGLVIISALAFFAFRPQKTDPTAEAKVKVSIDAPEMVPSGNEAIYKFTILNEDPSKLVDMELEIVYDSMTYISSSPKANNLSGNLFQVPDLSTGQNAVVMVKVEVQGNVNDQKTLVAKLKYKYDNFSSPFVKEVSHTTRIVAADIILDISGSDEVNNSQVAEYTVNYRNNSEKEVPGGRLQITYPEGFSFANSSPDTTLGNNIWDLETLKPKESGTIKFQGSFGSARPGDEKTFKIEFLVADEKGDYYAQSASAFTTKVSSQPLLIEQKIQGSSEIVNPGEGLSYEIKFQNNAAVVATGVSIVVELDSPAIDVASIKSDTGLVRDNSITWNASGVAALERLNPTDSGTVRFTVKLNNPAVGSSVKEAEVKSTVKIKSNEFKDFLPGNNLAIKVSSPSELLASANHSGGSLPPKVGTESSYTVYIELKNSSNDLVDGTLSAFVPLGVKLDTDSINSRERSLVKYDQSTGKLVWTVGQLVAHAGRGALERVLSFKVRFTPTQGQANSALPLLKTLDFRAKDGFTKEAVKLELRDVTTQDSPNGGADGRVQN